MELKFNFLIQATRVLDINSHDDDALNSIYRFLLSLDNDTLIRYNNSQTLVTYSNDLELYLEILNSLIRIYEYNEEYEKCDELLKQKKLTINLLKNF